MIDVSSIADRVTLDTNGIWRSVDQESVSYPAGGNEACFSLEDASFWFNHRNRCIVAAVRNLPPRNNGPIFDIGGGNGFVSVGLNRAGFDAVVVEPGPVGAANAKARGVHTVICATTKSAGIRRSVLEAVGLFDVIEHVENDLPFLKEIRNLLKPGGRLYATVPAYMALWSHEDELAGHYRRYTLKGFESLVERAGFVVVYSTYIFRVLPLPILLLRALPYRLGIGKASGGQGNSSNDHQPPKGRAAGVINAVLDRELLHIERNGCMRFGGSCLVVARAS